MFWQTEELRESDPEGWSVPVPKSCLQYGLNIDER